MSGSSDGASGFLEAMDAGVWHDVCAQTLPTAVLDVVCKQLNYKQFLRWSVEKKRSEQSMLELTAACTGK
jgi:hypothetical protein